MRGQPGQPVLFLGDLFGGPVDAWEPHDHIAAQPVERIVRPGGLHSFDGQPGPLRELFSQQGPYELRIGVDLVVMQCGYRSPLMRGSATSCRPRATK